MKPPNKLSLRIAIELWVATSTLLDIYLLYPNWYLIYISKQIIQRYSDYIG